MTLEQKVEKLREELYNANYNRALIYATIFDELKKELGEEKAKTLMKRAIYRRGEQVGQKFARFAPNDFAGLRDAFVGGIPDEGRMFGPEVTRCDAEGLDITFYNCPLKTAWQQAGMSEKECEDLCEVAGIIDDGTFEGAGFTFECDSLAKGLKDCCKLRIRKKT